MKRVGTKSMNVFSTNPMTTTNILNVTEGADFRVISLGSGTTIRDFIGQFIKHPLLTSPNKTSLGGEHVLTTLHATKVHVDSYHLMYFQGTQERHYHIGPRLLNVFASEPWSVFLGGTNLSVLAQDTIAFAEIIFPANSYTQLRFRARNDTWFQRKRVCSYFYSLYRRRGSYKNGMLGKGCNGKQRDGKANHSSRFEQN